MHITPDRPAAVVFAPGLPFPPRSGLDLRVLASVRAVARTHTVGVFALTAGPSGDLGSVDAEVRVCVSRRFAATTATTLPAQSLQWLREPDGHPSDRWYDDAVMAELAEFARGVGARVVVLETLWLHGYIAPLRARGYAVILNAHGIEAALHDELAERTTAPLARMFAQRTRQVEARALRAVDEVWIPSPRETADARHRYGAGLPLRVVPNAIDVERYARDRRPAAGPFTVIFTASFAYPPNVVAADRLLTGIFPALTETIPSARLALVGRDPSPELSAAAAADDRIEVTGVVDDVAVHLHRASAMAVPLSEGHGTRFKVLEAFAAGIPVVGSAKGLEGIDAVAHEHYLPAESDGEFAAALAALARDPPRGERLTRNALRLVRERYSLATVTESVGASLASLSIG